jgi:hypothetical protein
MNEVERKRKKPLIAVLLSILIPGVGQIYTEQLAKGVAIMLLNMAINVLVLEPLSRLDFSKALGEEKSTFLIVSSYGLASLVLWIYAIVDAKIAADRINASLEG